MKKINLILSACVLAAALFVSCNNETPKDWTNVTTVNNNYAYAVTGTMTTTLKNGTTTAASVNVTKATINKARAYVSWTEDKVDGHNYQNYSVSFNGTANYTFSNTPAGSTTTTTVKAYDEFGTAYLEQGTDTVPTGYYDMSAITDPYDVSEWTAAFISSDHSFDVSTIPAAQWVPAFELPNGTQTVTVRNRPLELYDFDGVYYIKYKNEFVALPEEAFDGFFGDDEFTLNFTLSNKDTRTGLTQSQHEETNVVQSEEIAYSFTFKLVDAE